MKTVVQFSLSKCKKYYVAQEVELPIVTQAKTLDKLIKNICEAVGVFLENEDPKKMGVVKEPSVLVNFELPHHLYA